MTSPSQLLIGRITVGHQNHFKPVFLVTLSRGNMVTCHQGDGGKHANAQGLEGRLVGPPRSSLIGSPLVSACC